MIEENKQEKGMAINDVQIWLNLFAYYNTIPRFLVRKGQQQTALISAKFCGCTMAAFQQRVINANDHSEWSRNNQQRRKNKQQRQGRTMTAAVGSPSSLGWLICCLNGMHRSGFSCIDPVFFQMVKVVYIDRAFTEVRRKMAKHEIEWIRISN